jgi:hypothetical protein
LSANSACGWLAYATFWHGPMSVIPCGRALGWLTSSPTLGRRSHRRGRGCPDGPDDQDSTAAAIAFSTSRPKPPTRLARLRHTASQIPQETRDSCGIFPSGAMCRRLAVLSAHDVDRHPTPPSVAGVGHGSEPRWLTLLTSPSRVVSSVSRTSTSVRVVLFASPGRSLGRSARSGACVVATSAMGDRRARQPQGAPSQQGRMNPHPSQRSWEVSQRISVSQLGHGSVRSATIRG